MSEDARQPFKIGGVQVEPERNLLVGENGPVRIEPKVMDVFVTLAGADGEVVSRDALIDHVWSIENGGDESVSRAISLLRKALKEAGLSDEVVETVPKRGYRLAISHEFLAAPSAAAQSSTAEPSVDGANRRSKLSGAVLVAFLVAMALGIASYLQLGEKNVQTDNEMPVVAVLPFDDLSPRGDYAWFAEGLADELIDNLARVPDIIVIGRRSSFKVRHTNLDSRAIGAQLGARYLIEGGVRRDGDQLRVSAILVDTKDQSTLWSETYEREGEDVFAIQSELARAIVRALNTRMSGPDPASMIGTKNPAAFDAFLMGQAYLRAEGEDNILRATAQFRRAAELDPDYLHAWKGLYASLSVYDFWHPEQLKAAQLEAKQALEHAIELAPDDEALRLMYGWISAANGDMIEADRTFRNVLKGQSPDGCNDRSFIEILLWGRIDPGYAKCLETQKEMYPYDLSIAEGNQNLGRLIGREDMVRAEYERSKSIPGGPGTGEQYAILRALKSGDRNAARASLRRLIDFLPAKISQFEKVYENFDNDAQVVALLNEARVDPANQDPTRLIMIASLLAAYGDAEGAADALRRHYLEVGGTWWHELWMPEFADARRQPAFKQIIREKGFEKFFRKSGEWNNYCRPLSETDFECF